MESKVQRIGIKGAQFSILCHSLFACCGTIRYQLRLPHLDSLFPGACSTGLMRDEYKLPSTQCVPGQHFLLRFFHGCYISKRFYMWNNCILWSNNLFFHPPKAHTLANSVPMSWSAPFGVIPASCKGAWCLGLMLPFSVMEYSKNFCALLTTTFVNLYWSLKLWLAAAKL